MGSSFRLDVWRTEESHSARAVAACCSTPESVKIPSVLHGQTTEGHHHLPATGFGTHEFNFMCLFGNRASSCWFFNLTLHWSTQTAQLPGLNLFAEVTK